MKRMRRGGDVVWGGFVVTCGPERVGCACVGGTGGFQRKGGG